MNEDKALKKEIELNNELWEPLTEHEKYMFSRGFKAGEKQALDLATVSNQRRLLIEFLDYEYEGGKLKPNKIQKEYIVNDFLSNL